MDRVRLECEFNGPRRIDELRRQAEARRLVAAARAPDDPLDRVLTRLRGWFASVRTRRPDRRPAGEAVRDRGPLAPARHNGG